MKKMRRLLWFTISVLACAIVPLQAAEEKKPSEPSLKDRIYHFEHRLLPKWTHGTQGAFFSDLSKGTVDRLKEAATDIVGPDFAAKLAVRPSQDATQILITFQTPFDPPLCFYALVLKKGDTYRYFTLELTEDILGNGTKAVFGEWDEAGGHKNLGTRKYSDAESFIDDAAKIAEKKG